MIDALEAILRRPKTVFVLMLALIVAGTYTYMTIPKEDSPDIDVPVFYVSIAQQGISPEDADRLLVRPMETELRGLGARFEGGKPFERYVCREGRLVTGQNPASAEGVAHGMLMALHALVEAEPVALVGPPRIDAGVDQRVLFVPRRQILVIIAVDGNEQ